LAIHWKKDTDKTASHLGTTACSYLRLTDIEFPGEESVPCSEESPAHSVCKGNLAGTKTPRLPPGILVKRHPVKPQGPNFGPAALSGQTQHNGFLKPHERFILLLHREVATTITALESTPSLAEAAG